MDDTHSEVAGADCNAPAFWPATTPIPTLLLPVPSVGRQSQQPFRPKVRTHRALAPILALTSAPPPLAVSLLHCLIAARDTVVLVEHDASPSGGQSYAQATQTILSKIPPNDSKLTYAADQILIHYQKLGGVVALVVAEDSAGRRMPFAFLAELHKRFTAKYGPDEIEDAPAFGMASYEKDIAKLMQQYTDSPPNDPIKTAQAELNNVKDIMVKNIDAVLSRGERIELLVDKTDHMSTQARAFRKRSTQLRSDFLM
ncbi:hypothetical protein P7C70_g4847, partial [Phenoliferia sp. Uapishka_3]